jgi:hypothetical protein
MLPYQQGLGSMRPGSIPITPRMRQPVPMRFRPVVCSLVCRSKTYPAFQYAAQNYQRGGSQRLMDRPIEMMSAAERRTINDMSRAMAEQAQQQQEYDMGTPLDGQRRWGGWPTAGSNAVRHANGCWRDCRS